jgi:6-phosphogluconolactonase/glucosamine-6-phosphate isomerase/deaminase
LFTRYQRLDAAISLAESNAHPSDEDNDRLLNLYSEQRTLRADIQALTEKETVGGPATISFSHRVLQSAEEILVLGKGVAVADVVLDAFGPSGRGNGPAKTAISQVSAALSWFNPAC